MRFPWRLVRVRGRSMLPTLVDGDLVIVRLGAAPTAGCLAVVRLPPDRHGVPRPLGIKRVVREESPGRWWIDSDNAAAGVTSFDIGTVVTRDVLAVVVTRLPGRRRRGREVPQVGHEG